MPCLSPHIAQLALQSTWHVLHFAKLAKLAKLAKPACLHGWQHMTAYGLMSVSTAQWLADMRTMFGGMRSAPARDVLKTPVWALFQV